REPGDRAPRMRRSDLRAGRGRGIPGNQADDAGVTAEGLGNQQAKRPVAELRSHVRPRLHTEMGGPGNGGTVSNDVRLRVARPTDRLDEVERFYSVGLGLSVLDSFQDHEGFDGAMLGHPGAPYHLE